MPLAVHITEDHFHIKKIARLKTLEQSAGTKKTD